MKRTVAFEMLARQISRRTGKPLEEITERTAVPDYRVVQELAATGLCFKPGDAVKDVLDQLVLD